MSSLIAVGAGFAAGPATGVLVERKTKGTSLLLYCVKGFVSCEVAGTLHALRKGEALFTSSDVAYCCRPGASEPWAAHWVEAAGLSLGHYSAELGAATGARVLCLGEDAEATRLFGEILRALQRASGMKEVLRASNALAHLLAVVIDRTDETAAAADPDTTRKVAEAIMFMSEHLSEPVRVSALARLVSLSPTYFTGLFKQQTGSSPREYLQLLRLHRACQLLATSNLSIKQIASKIGYQDQFHFSRQFKQFQGLCPTVYRTAGPLGRTGGFFMAKGDSSIPSKGSGV